MGSEKERGDGRDPEDSDRPLEDTEEDVFQPDRRLLTTWEARPKRLLEPKS